MFLSAVLFSWQLQFSDHQRINQFQVYQAQMDTVGMAGLEKHRPVSRTQSSPAASSLPQPTADQPVKHVYETGRTP